MDIYFYLVAGTALIFGIAFALSTRGIYYGTPDTDNELLAYAAAQSHKWRWPSDIHRYSIGKTYMKNVTIFGLVIFQKIFRNKTTDYPYTVMTGWAVSLSSILIYLILQNYFGSQAAFLAAIFYIISFWPWQVSLYGGHANIANLCFLLAIYALQQPLNGVLAIISFPIAGIFICLSLFSSPSSNKYLISFWGAASFTQYELLKQSGFIDGFYSLYVPPWLNTISVAIILLLILAYMAARLSIPHIVTRMYKGQAPGFLSRVIIGQNIFPIGHYLHIAHKKLKKLFRITLITIFFLILTLYFVGILQVIYIFTGWFITLLILTLPNVKQNIKNYFSYMYLPQRKTHFYTYVNYFAKRGITVKPNTRGAGLSWVPKMLWLFIPFHAIIFIASFVAGQYKSISAGDMTESISLIVVTFIALSPIIWAEMTKAPQASRLYSPGLVTILLLPAYILSNITWTIPVLIIFSGLGILIFVWNFWRFMDDIYPARMAVRNFMKIIQRLNINDIYTYKTSFNISFVNAIPGISQPAYLPKKDIAPPFNVHYIQQLDEVADGWIAIPGTSGKALTATDSEGMNGDYTKDPLLNQLIESKQIEKIATAKFKTYGTSTIWINEDDITSYRSIHLKDIGPDDLYRGFAWLIHSSSIKKLYN